MRRNKGRCTAQLIARCQSGRELEESIQSGLDQQGEKDADTRKKAREYKQLNDQLEVRL